MEYFITIFVAIIGSGVLNTLLNYCLTIRERKKEDRDGVKKACRLLMKNEIRRLAEHYIEQGWIYDDELEDLMAMHKCYHNELGGNGFLDELMSRVRRLEIRGDVVEQ